MEGGTHIFDWLTHYRIMYQSVYLRISVDMAADINNIFNSADWPSCVQHGDVRVQDLKMKLKMHNNFCEVLEYL